MYFSILCICSKGEVFAFTAALLVYRMGINFRGVGVVVGTGLLCLFFTYYAMLQCSNFLPIMLNIMLM